jgi:hypothetical protein
VYGVDYQDKAMLRKQLRKNEFLSFFATLLFLFNFLEDASNGLSFDFRVLLDDLRKDLAVWLGLTPKQHITIRKPNSHKSEGKP